ncbi:MAG: hypothetical protein JRJ84_13395 [Deltaproteobacteria bacterium]|nr:hypothetical protein [Deltaproteobacteria bacterium]
MGGFDRERLERLSAELEEALGASSDPGAPHVLGQVKSVLDSARAGDLDAPRKSAPGGRHFIESNLPGDPVVSSLYTDWCNVVEARDTERLGVIHFLHRTIDTDDLIPAAEVAASGVVPADKVSREEKFARRCHPTEAVQSALDRAEPGGMAEDVLTAVAGSDRAGLVHLGTRLGRDGSHLRTYALPGGGVIEMFVASDGTLVRLDILSGAAGYEKVRAAARRSWKLPERHRTYPTVRSWGEAYAHARSLRGSVISVREHYDANPRVVLACEQPTHIVGTWFPRFAGDGPEPTVERERFTRTYRIADRRIPHVAHMGIGASMLNAAQWGLLASVLLSTANARTPSQFDRAVARAALNELLAMIPEGADALPEETLSSPASRRVREARPEFFTREGIQALLTGAAGQ